MERVFFAGQSRVVVLWLIVFSLLTGCSLPSSNTGEQIAAITGAPIVELAAPLPNSTFLKGVGVNILAAVSNAGSDIQRVEIKVADGTVADVASPNPSGAARFSVTHTWLAEAQGEYTIEVIAFRGNGAASAPATVKINVVDDLPATEAPTATEVIPTNTVQPTNTTVVAAVSPTQNQSVPVATATTDSSVPAATATSAGVTVRVVRGGMNVRRGPSTNFVPPLGVLPGEQDVPVLAANPNATWFKIMFNGAEAWISSDPSLVTVVSGDVSSLPRESGPPIPTLAPATLAATAIPTGVGATPETPATTNGANLVVANFVLDPADPFCNRNAQMRANISNIGNEATASGGFVVLVVENTDGTNRQTLGAVEIPILAAGQQNFTIALDFKDPHVSNRGDGIKRAFVIIDPNNQIPESNENDNVSAADEYALGVPCDP